MSQHLHVNNNLHDGAGGMGMAMATMMAMTAVTTMTVMTKCSAKQQTNERGDK